MAVLIEGISVVVKVASILKIYNNDVEKFDQLIPNQQFCSDNELFRVSFMDSNDVKIFIQLLERKGFIFLENNLSKDIVTVDQKEGLLTNCNWIEFYKYEVQEDKYVIGCKLKGGIEESLFQPDSWSYDESLYTLGEKIAENEISEKLTFVEKKNNLSEYINNDTGEIVYVGRTN